MKNGNGTAISLHSRDGATQGDPLEMIAYGICILPLIKNLKREFTDVAQPWYADDARALGKFARIEAYFHSLEQKRTRIQVLSQTFKKHSDLASEKS